MARKPKVYVAEIDGLHEWIVAAPNQAEALAAFGVNQNLFQQGLAHPTDEAVAVEAAAAAPGVPLRRLKGSRSPFRPADSGNGEAWEKAAKAAAARAPHKKPKAKRDRTRLDRAEAELAKFEAEAREKDRALQQEIEAIERQREALADAQGARRERLRQAVDEARRAYEGRS